MAASTRTVKVKFDGDAKDFQRATDAAEKAMAKFGKSTAKLGDFGKKAGAMLGKGMAAGAVGLGIAAAGIGALIVSNVGKALEQGAIKAKLAAQLGASGEDAKRLGKLTGKLFVDGYGESMDETAGMIKTVFEQGLVSLRNTDAEIRGVVEAVSTYTTLTGEDAVGATRAVSQAIKTGLVKDAQQGFDLITRAQQLGINKSEDLLDTLNEYGTQFRKLGLDGTTALGLINQLIRGGARDSDVAADAIKEFAIRAVDGSKTTAAGFKALNLDAGKMAAAIAKGGPTAKAAFGDILDGLNGIKDPVKRNLAGVALFGTQWEDLGDAIKSADLDTAAQSMGNVAGANERANAALSNTPAAKLQKAMRTLQQVFVDAIGKYIVPHLEKFADWFNGPGKFAIVEWALEGTSAILEFADKLLGAVGSSIGGLTKFAKVALIAAAGMVAVTNPAFAVSLLKQADSMDQWGKDAETGIGKARNQLKGWDTAVKNAKTKVKLEADKADLDRKLAAAKLQLKDPKLSATKRAKLEADIRQLEAAKAKAQRAIDALHGKTVTITANVKLNQSNVRSKIDQQLSRAGIEPGRASGGLMQPGRRYLTSERGPEIVEMGQNGGARVISGEQTTRELAGGNSGPLIVENHIEIGGEVVRVVRTEIKADNANTKRRQTAGVR